MSNVDHPQHYGGRDNPCETIKVIKSLDMLHDFCIGNAIKYLMRAGKKGQECEKQDLEKARWYIDYLLKDMAISSQPSAVGSEQFYTQEERENYRGYDLSKSFRYPIG